jgi:putative acetyltransferase
MNVTIRTVLPTDNASLASLIRAVFHEFDAPKEGTVYSDPSTNNLYSLFEQEGAALFVLEASGAALGCCGIYPTAGLPLGCAEVVKFYFSPQIRGKGWGLKLLLHCEEWAKEQGYDALYIESLAHFKQALRLYEKLNYQVLETPLGAGEHPGCDLWYSKNL